MPVPITVDDVASAVRSVWTSAGGVGGSNAVLNRRPSQLTPPVGVLTIAGVEPERESDGIAFYKFDVTVMAMVTDPTVTRLVGQTIVNIPTAIVSAGVSIWPAGTRAVPDVVLLGSGTLDTDMRPRPGGGDLFALSIKFRVVIQPATP